MPRSFKVRHTSARFPILSGVLLCVAAAFAPLASGAFTRTPPSALTEPSAQAATHTIHRLALATNDLVYDEATRLIYASVPGRVGAGGNSITPINPALSTVGVPVFVGSEPRRMAISGDGQFIYVGLEGAGAVRRFNVAAQTPDRFFYLGSEPFNGPYAARDIAVMPGRPETIAVARRQPCCSPDDGGVAIYDDGVQRPAVAGRDTSSQGATHIEFAASASTVYGFTGQRLQRIDVSPSGLSISRSVALPTGDMQSDGGLLYSPAGQVIDPEAERVVGTFDLQGASPFLSLVMPDPVADRVYFVVVSNGSYVLRVYEKQSRQPVGSLTIAPSVTFDMGSLIRWGTNGLAFRAGDNVFLIHTPLVPSNGDFPPPPPAPSATPTPTPVPTPGPGELRILQLGARHLVVEPRSQTIYASIASSAATGANSITPIDPVTATPGNPVFVGNEPGRMAVSEDGRIIYVALDGERAVRRFDVDSQTPDIKFDIGQSPFSGPWQVRDMAVMPGRPETVAVARFAGISSVSVALYDGGVQRPGADSQNGSDFIEFSTNPSLLYGYHSGSSEHLLKRLLVAPCGVGTGRARRNLLSGFADFDLDNGIIYSSGGAVVDPEAEVRLGSFASTDSFITRRHVVSDSNAGRTYFVTRNLTNGLLSLRAYDQQTFLEVGALNLPGLNGEPRALVRWDADGFAVLTETGQVGIIQTSLVAPPRPLPPAPAPTPATPTIGLSGHVSDFGTPVAGVTVTLSGSQTATTTTDAAGNFSFPDLAPCGDYTVTPSSPVMTFIQPPQTFNTFLGSRTANFDAIVRRFSLFGETNVSEGTRRIVVFVLRTGDSSSVPASIDYATADGTASERTDYTAAAGTLRFAPGENSKPIVIVVADDAFAESPETLTLKFSNPNGALPLPSDSVTLTINSNDAADGPSPVKDASLDVDFFVRQHYADFLGRAPDQAGLDFWKDSATNCGAADPLVCRVNVSAAFFLSIENQETGYLAYRAHKAAYGNLPGKPVPLTLREHLAGSRRIGDGVVVGVGKWQQQLEENKAAFFDEFTQTARFKALYDAHTNAQFVDALSANTGGALSTDESNALKNDLDTSAKTRAQVLRAVAEDADFARAEQNRAFVLAQYFGYLRRNPDEPDFRGIPDPNFDGYNFWLTKLNQFNGNFVAAEMVKAFIQSIEYGDRFGR